MLLHLFQNEDNIHLSFTWYSFEVLEIIAHHWALAVTYKWLKWFTLWFMKSFHNYKRFDSLEVSTDVEDILKYCFILHQ